MDLIELQKRVMSANNLKVPWSQIPHSQQQIYGALGLAGEAGEVADEYKKLIRDDGRLIGRPGDPRRGKILTELADTLFYLVALSVFLGCDLETLAERLLQKIEKD
jgi:NTP pyrophosphatase (non-canonical NTP hydrolase)